VTRGSEAPRGGDILSKTFSNAQTKSIDIFDPDVRSLERCLGSLAADAKSILQISQFVHS
jgi:hypothetical protein